MTAGPCKERRVLFLAGSRRAGSARILEARGRGRAARISKRMKVEERGGVMHPRRGVDQVVGDVFVGEWRIRRSCRMLFGDPS